MQCKEGSFGPQCKGTCQCLNNATCDKTDGTCDCLPGWIGVRCDNPCPAGYYGKYCQSKCKCQNGGSCDPVDGNCTCVNEWQGQTCDLCKLALQCCYTHFRILYYEASSSLIFVLPRRFQRQVYSSRKRGLQERNPSRAQRVDHAWMLAACKLGSDKIGPLFLRPFLAIKKCYWP